MSPWSSAGRPTPSRRTVYDRRRKGFVAWVRRGAGDHEASESDLRQMAYDSEPRADRRALEEFETSSLCPDTIKRYRSIFAERKPRSPWVADGDEDFLYHVGALAKGADGRATLPGPDCSPLATSTR